MQLDKIYDRLYHVRLEKHEVLVLDRYVMQLKNAEITSAEALIANMLQSQVDFVIDSLVEEADIKMTDVNPRYSRWQRCMIWLGRL